jgi:hypothetical protein
MCCAELIPASLIAARLGIPSVVEGDLGPQKSFRRT